MYLVATGGNPGAGANANLVMTALLPTCLAGKSSSIDINEVTTVASVLAAGQFFNTGLGSTNAAPLIGGTCTGCGTGTYNRGLVAAFSNTYPMLVDNPTGTSILSGIANGISITRESAKINTIANVIATCVNSTGATSTTETTTNCGQLFTGVNATASTPRASTTLQAALQIVLYPYYNVANVYAFSTATPPFIGLSSAPNDWTTAISYTTPSFGLGIQLNTSSDLDIDKSGNVWFPSNQTGAKGLGYFAPASATFNGPYGQNLTYPQYVALDQNTSPVAWVTDNVSSNVSGVLTTAPGTITSASTTAYTTGGPIALDNSNHVIFPGNTTASHFLYTLNTARTGIVQAMYVVGSQTGPINASAAPNGVANPLTVPYTNSYVFFADTTTACNLEFTEGGTPSDGVSTGTSACLTGGVLSANYTAAFVTTSTGYLCSYVAFQAGTCTAASSLSNAKGLALDGTSHIWVANAGNASVAPFSINFNSYTEAVVKIGTVNGYLHGTGNGATATTPYGIGIDGSGNVWVSNASCVSTTSTNCAASGFTLTEIVGVAAPTITPVSLQEIGTSPQSGTRPTN